MFDIELKELSISLNPNAAFAICGIDLRLVINGLQKPLKRFVHRD